jgi:hypothetical protein
MILKTLLGLAVILGGLAVCYGVGRAVLRVKEGDWEPSQGTRHWFALFPGVIAVFLLGMICFEAFNIGNAILGGR